MVLFEYRLFGIVNRTTIMEQEKEKNKLICHVMEAQNGMAVRHCVAMAINCMISTKQLNYWQIADHQTSVYMYVASSPTPFFQLFKT